MIPVLTNFLQGFSHVSFAHPFILSGLLALPALWYLLRITPPAPRRITLPSARFLAGLIPTNNTPSRTPLWIFLLRLLTASLIILALAGPVINPPRPAVDQGPVCMVFDNSWASAASWDKQHEAARDILAAHQGNTAAVHVLTTTPALAEKMPTYRGPMTAGQTADFLRTLAPQPWKADYAAALSLMESKKSPEKCKTYWLSSGVWGGGFDKLATHMAERGRVSVFMPDDAAAPAVLHSVKPSKSSSLEVNIVSAPGSERAVIIDALDDGGQVVDQSTVTLSRENNTALDITMPNFLRNKIAQMRLRNVPGAASIYLLDSRAKKKFVGLLSPADTATAKPFIEGRYYIRRAMEPFTKMTEGPAAAIIKKNVTAIIAIDDKLLTGPAAAALEEWVKDGGFLIRFADSDPARTASAAPELLPVALRAQQRSLGGDVSWDKPRAIGAFRPASPLSGITIHENIIVRRQILAEPLPDDNEEEQDKTWAALDDGTPLISAAPLGDGMLVYFHTSASPEWSDLPLSGTFVEILQRLADLSFQAAQSGHAAQEFSGLLEPVMIMDGMGQLHKPDQKLPPVNSASIKDLIPSPMFPPGIYNANGHHITLNLGESIESIRTIPADSGVYEKILYTKSNTLNLMPTILLLAFFLFVVDWLVMCVLSGGRPRLKPFASAWIAIVLACASPAHANDQDILYANNFYLAYMKTGDSAVDALSERGLSNLAQALRDRTSVEPGGVAGLDPERDNLVFFPVIYWPVTLEQKPLSEQALAHIQTYLDNGGTIFFDTRDGASGIDNAAGSSHASHLGLLIGRLNIAALIPMPGDHVMMKSFYLLRETPGRLESGSLWVEAESAPGRDGVSSVIIGSNDWAGAWSETDPETAQARPDRRQELAFRFGINTVIYALTGNYKADQVHVKNILEKLGQ